MSQIYDSQVDEESFDDAFSEFDASPDDKGLEALPEDAVEDVDALIQDAQAAREFADEAEGKVADKPEGKEAKGAKKLEEAPPADDLTVRATEIGLSKEEVAELGEKGTRRLIELHEKRVLSVGRDLIARRQAPAQQPTAQPAAASTGAKREGFKFEWGDDKESLSPAVMKNLEAMHAHHQQELAEIREAFGQVIATRTDAADAAEEAAIDKWFESKADMVDLFGKGRVREIVDTPAFKARMEVAKEAHAIEEGRKALGYPALPKEESFDRALRAVHGDRLVKKAEESAKKETVKAVKAQTEEIVSRPSRRVADDGMSVKQRARQRAIERARAKGFDA